MAGKLRAASRQNAPAAALKEYGALRRTGRAIDDEVLARISPACSESVNFHGTIAVDYDRELAQLDGTGHRLLRGGLAPVLETPADGGGRTVWRRAHLYALPSGGGDFSRPAGRANRTGSASTRRG
ncbi:hypothetical protein [Yinghuangia sp. YIM S09857]|uniref:hypothetical protein n=1 Tax=Yinghuangia sp. YIM S09857 TaxID=3436929 RepID=UPI003F52F905